MERQWGGKWLVLLLVCLCGVAGVLSQEKFLLCLFLLNEKPQLLLPPIS